MNGMRADISKIGSNRFKLLLVLEIIIFLISVFSLTSLASMVYAEVGVK
jgi:hypothetical protein